jgi:hypothetical protein
MIDGKYARPASSGIEIVDIRIAMLDEAGQHVELADAGIQVGRNRSGNRRRQTPRSTSTAR